MRLIATVVAIVACAAVGVYLADNNHHAAVWAGTAAVWALGRALEV